VGWAKGRLDGQSNSLFRGWTDGWGWMDGWTDGRAVVNMTINSMFTV
jgi:hypothetical protein